MKKKITRPEVLFDPDDHIYTIEGSKMWGVSTVAKIGEDEVWHIAAGWAWRIGYEGAYDALEIDKHWEGVSKDTLREILKQKKLTPNDTKGKAAKRGTWAHDTWEALVQKEELPPLITFTKEVREHVRAILRFDLKYRPKYEAAEVQVASERYHFAGRYDCRCYIEARLLVPLFVGHRSAQAKRVHELAQGGLDALVLIDLKTSKDVYPTSHFPQLAGYELASVEMGFPPTDAQFVLNTHEDGTYKLAPSWAIPEDFVRYLFAAQAIERIKANDPETLMRPEREDRLLSLMPATMRELIGMAGHQNVKGMLMSLKKQGRASVSKGIWSAAAPTDIVSNDQSKED